MQYTIVMSTITIKNVPATVHRALKAKAKAHGRSLNREILATLEGLVRSTRIDADSVMEHARSVREAIGGTLTQNSLTRYKTKGRR